MDYTLKEKLDALDILTENVGSPTDVKNGILEKFVARDPLAYEVSHGRTSYSQSIEPILERYKPFWRKIGYQSRDEKFNDYVNETIGSINNVGIEGVNPELYTTNGRNKIVGVMEIPSIVAGLFAASVMTLMYFTNLPENEDLADRYIPYIFLSPVIPYLMFKLLPFEIITQSLNRLKESAQKTDEFIRTHYTD